MGLHIPKIAMNHVLICLMRTLETIHDTPVEQEGVYRKIIKLHSKFPPILLEDVEGRGAIENSSNLCEQE